MSRGLLTSLVLALVTVSGARAAVPELKVRELQVEVAFGDEDGNLIVRFWPRGTGLSNRTYWGPRGENKLYELKEKLYQPPQNGHTFYFKGKIAAPSAEDPERLADLRTEGKEEVMASCENIAQCFTRISLTSERLLADRIRTGKVELVRLPDVKEIAHHFVIADSDQHLVLISPRMHPSLDFEILAGPAGQLRAVEIVRAVHPSVRDAATLVLQDGRILHLPSLYEKLPPVIYDSQMDLLGTELIEHPKSVEALAALGADVAPFRMPQLSTPVTGPGRCRGIFKD